MADVSGNGARTRLTDGCPSSASVAPRPRLVRAAHRHRSEPPAPSVATDALAREVLIRPMVPSGEHSPSLSPLPQPCSHDMHGLLVPR